jgi:outer membrane receptor protein involved in Fe transport
VLARLLARLSRRGRFAGCVALALAPAAAPGSAGAPAAPIAATTEVDPEAAPAAPLPAPLRLATGVRIVRLGLHQAVVDTRGLESSTPRRLTVRIDGRDATEPLGGAAAWAALTFAGEDLERVVLERGPAAARHGGGAYGGMLELVTRSPRNGRKEIRLAAGERDSGRAWASWAGPATASVHVGASGGFDRSRGFGRSRVAATEYPGAPRERLPLAGGGERIGGFDLRLERDLAARASLRLGAGTTAIAGPLAHGELDRQQVVDATAPWMRFELATPSRHLRASWTRYRSRRQRALGLGRERWLDAHRYAVELAGERPLGDRARVDLGLVVQGELAGSRDGGGRETWLDGPVRDSLQGLWGSCDLDLGARARATLGARIDRASDGDTRLSPRLGLAYRLGEAHALRIAAGRGFRRPSAEQRALEVPLQDPLDLSALEAAYGLELGFAAVPVLALGNPLLRPETVSSVEGGYGGRFGRRLRLDFDVHHGRHRGLTSSLLPGVAAAHPRYSLPVDVPPELAALFLQTLARFLDPGVRAGLVSRPDGSPAVVQSFADSGEAVVRGADLGVRVRIAESWQATLAYSLLDFLPEHQARGDVLVANAPDHHVALTLAHAGPLRRLQVGWRWQPEFEWAAAGARGIVPQLADVDLALGQKLGAGWEVGLRVTNLLDRRRYEAFGGDVLGRRALLTLARSWS